MWGTDSRVRTYPWGFFLLSSENDDIVMLFRRQVCRIAALFPGVLPPFRIVCGRGWGSVLVGVDTLVVNRFLLVVWTPRPEFNESVGLPLTRRLPPFHGVLVQDALWHFLTHDGGG